MRVYGLIDLLNTDLNSNLQNCQALGFKKNNEMIFNKVGSLVPLHKMDEDLPGYAWTYYQKRIKPLIYTELVIGILTFQMKIDRLLLRYIHHSVVCLLVIFV